MISERKQRLLELVIEKHIETAEPIGSKFLVSTGNLDVSDATVRNEMRDLEEKGYLTHPHTSAGRVPTEAGYRYYIQYLIKKEEKPPKALQEAVAKTTSSPEEGASRAKYIAKHVAEYAHNAVIVAFGLDSVYYTGMSYLFSQPEFQNIARTVSISSIFDHCEDHIEALSDKMEKEKTYIFVGSDNPLGSDCSVVGFKTNDELLVAILGPIRMKYKQNIAILNYLLSHQ
jgi:heat-inducible transcriptional repressor